MFDWIGDVAEWLGKFVPRLEVMNTTECGIAFVRGKPKVIQPGRLYIWMPLWTEIVTRPFVRQTINLPVQTLMVEHNEKLVSLMVSAVVVYEVRDIQLAICQTEDLEAAIRDLALASVKDAVCEYTLEALIDEAEAVDKAILRSLRAKLYSLGVKVRNVFLSDITTCRVLRVAGGGAIVGEDENGDGSDD
jgi:regulator of protease activity HflC (stomatin/prohibitin superfamily)